MQLVAKQIWIHHLARLLNESHWNSVLLAEGGREQHAPFPLAKVEWLEGKNPQ